MDRGSDSPSAAPIQIMTGGVTLEGDLTIPSASSGIVVFAHGSGSSRLSARNQFVARMFREAGLATLLMDLLTAQEEAVDMYTRHLRFNIPLLAERVTGATDWLLQNEQTRELAIGLFGASTGAAAALVTAAERPAVVRAVVSRGGRPDLADLALDRVRAPTLLIVGGADDIVIQLNQAALARLGSEKRLEIIPGAAHLFEEPGALEAVGRLAADWFTRYLTAQAEPRSARETK